MRANTFWQIESSNVSFCEWWQHSFLFMKASSSLRWKDQGFQTGAGVIFPMALLVCLVHWTESVTMTVIADFRLWWHPHWPHVLPLLISLPLHFFHIFLLPCFSAPDCFWHEASGWAENMWENITRVFTGAEKAGQTNHLSLYCSTFPSQTLQCFNAECCKMIECI